jgi:5-methylcytosine-specific restriction endonuclease McrA
MTRSLPDWIGRDSDEAIPARVKVRIFEKYEGKCAACTLKIVGKLLPAYDHRIAIVNGGSNTEDNIQLLCEPCHKLKTHIDTAQKAVMYRKRKKAIGIKKKPSFRGWRKMDGSIVWRKP